MPILYDRVARQVMYHTDQFGDALSVSANEANYIGNLATVIGRLDVPFTLLKQKILSSEKRIVRLVGDSNIWDLRDSLFGKTAVLQSGARIPGTDDVADHSPAWEFYGKVSSWRSAEEPYTSLTEKKKQTIDRINRMRSGIGGAITEPVFHFAQVGDRIYHTVHEVVKEGVVWDYDTQSTAYGDADNPDPAGESPLHSSLEQFLIADVCVNLEKVGWSFAEIGNLQTTVERAERSILQDQNPQTLAIENQSSRDPVGN